MKDKLDSIEKKHGKMLDEWEGIGQRLDKIAAATNVTDKKNKKKKFSYVDDVESITTHHLKSKVEKARELRKELHRS
jgi:hypothetical protein